MKKSVRDTDVQVVQLLRAFPFLSIYDIDEILEFLEDNDFLNEDGKNLRERFWKVFIKE